MQPSRDLGALRYVKAADVRGGELSLEDFEVRDSSGVRLGQLAGVLVDAGTGRVCHIVVGAWRGVDDDYGVLPLSTARIDSDRRVIVMLDLRPGDGLSPCGSCHGCAPCTYCTR